VLICVVAALCAASCSNTPTAPVSAAPGSYYLFSEENANACSVM